jgi:LacI family transcriptional regulator
LKDTGTAPMNLRELAESLGLSQTTVSRALNGYPEVAEGTRARVLAAARRHNYMPNARAKGLATGRTNAIGHIIPTSHSHEIVNPVFSDFILGAGEVYREQGFDMVLSLVADDEQARVYHELAARGTVDGIILHAPRVGDPRIAFLREVGLPFVVHGRASTGETDYSWVDVNNRRAFLRATEFLIDLGHRRIALINGLEHMDFAARRRQGYEDALAGRGLPLDAALVRHDAMTEAHGYESARALLAGRPAPTAFLAASIIVALGVRRAVEEAGLRPGRDVSIVTHDDELSYLTNAGDVPMFTAVRSSVRQAGRLCAELLIAHILDPLAPPCHRLLEAELTVGQSTGPAPTKG